MNNKFHTPSIPFPKTGKVWLLGRCVRDDTYGEEDSFLLGMFVTVIVSCSQTLYQSIVLLDNFQEVGSQCVG